jgi:hypothetical protein
VKRARWAGVIVLAVVLLFVVFAIDEVSDAFQR